MSKIASIDIGTNTVLLLVAELRPDGKLIILHEEQRIPRLGKGVDKSRNLDPESMNRVVECICEYQQILNSRYPDVREVVVTATSAVRDARNREVLLDLVFQKTGIQIEVLSGEQEAEFTYRGALSVLSDPGKVTVVLDIGGGSTEVAIGKSQNLIDRFSFDLGSVRQTERFLADDPPARDDVDRCRYSIRRGLQKRRFDLPENAKLIGVAGTVTSLAYMELGLEGYDTMKLNGTELKRTQIQEWMERIQKQSASRLLREFPEVMTGRADIFLAGLLILEEFMQEYAFEVLTVSTGGIRHGAVLSLGV